MLWVENMLTVSQLSKVTNTTPDAIRHYVRIGLLKPARCPDNGYKLFSDDDVKKAEFIRRAKGLGFTLRYDQTIADGPVALQNFRGKVVLVYFGYTNCPDACPMTMANWARAFE